MSNDIQILVSEGARLSRISRGIEESKEEIGNSEAAHQKEVKHWKNILENFKQKVISGKDSLDNPFESYVIANSNFYDPDNFQSAFKERVKKLKSTLEELSESGTVWFQPDSFRLPSKGEQYEILSLKKPGYSIDKSSIHLQGSSSTILTLEPVFSQKIFWPFLSQSGEKDAHIRLSGFSYPSIKFDIPEINTYNRNIEYLEERLKANPLALLKLKECMRGDISDKLQKEAADYIDNVALQAVKIIKSEFERVKENDKKIMQIDEKYNSPQRETGMYATEPVILDAEPDPVFAAIMSSEHRDERNWALRSLAQSFIDLNKTGLSSYSKPIEIRVMSGEKLVYNLPDFSKYIRGVLEIGTKKE